MPGNPLYTDLIILVLMRRGNLQTFHTWLPTGHGAVKLLIGMLALAALACNAFAGNLEPRPDTAEVSDQLPATTTPTASPTPSEVSTDGEARVSVLVDLNVRSGPGVQYDRVGFLSAGTTVSALGMDRQSGWWKIQCPAALDGEECWVSGRSQYVAAEHVQDVPTVAAPATPTTVPPTVEAGQGILAYASDGQLFVAGLDLNQNLPALSTDARQVSTSGGLQRFAFAADGRRIAYVAGNENFNSLNIVNVDGGDHRTLVTSTILPDIAGQDATQEAFLIDQIAWLPDGSGLAFNTSRINPAGADLGSREDLWLVTLAGKLAESFPAGKGGGKFVFETGDRIIFSRTAELARAAPGSEEQSSVLQFEPVNTASEYVFYPSVQLTDSGASVYVPAADPWTAGAETTIWQIPQTGPAFEISRIANIPLDKPVIWTSDGRRLAFIQETSIDDDTALRLVISAGDASGAVPYAGGPNIRFFAWQPGGEQFLYAGAGYYAVGQPQAPPTQILLPAGETAVDARWLADAGYLVNIVEPANQRWELRGANLSGETIPLASGPGLDTIFGVWLP